MIDIVFIAWGMQTEVGYVRCQADASLIAAAPDLLKACEATLFVIGQLQECQGLFQNSYNVNTVRELLESAIAKARGEVRDG